MTRAEMEVAIRAFHRDLEVAVTHGGKWITAGEAENLKEIVEVLDKRAKVWTGKNR